MYFKHMYIFSHEKIKQLDVLMSKGGRFSQCVNLGFFYFETTPYNDEFFTDMSLEKVTEDMEILETICQKTQDVPVIE